MLSEGYYRCDWDGIIPPPGGVPEETCLACWRKPGDLRLREPPPEQVVPPQPPGLITQAMNFAQALGTHISNGAPTVDDETFNKRIDLCLACPNVIGNAEKCRVCGCRLITKARWADMRCPLDPPKWDKVK